MLAARIKFSKFPLSIHRFRQLWLDIANVRLITFSEGSYIAFAILIMYDCVVHK